MSDDQKYVGGLSGADWFLLFHIFKWSGLWTAPTWAFVLLWVFVITELLVVLCRGVSAIVKAAR